MVRGAERLESDDADNSPWTGTGHPEPSRRSILLVSGGKQKRTLLRAQAPAWADIRRSWRRCHKRPGTAVQLYGELIQIQDDLNDTMTVPANPDWLQKRKPLPILFALTVEHPDHARFLDLYQNMSNENALQEAQDILIRWRAVSYCVDQLMPRYQTAQDILNKTPLPNKGVVEDLVQGVIAPVRKLFETLGVSPGILPTTAELSNPE